MDVHFVTVPANGTIAVDVPVTVDEVIHIAAVPFAVRDYILEIESLASESNSNSSSATSCSVAKWVRCCFSSKKEKTF